MIRAIPLSILLAVLAFPGAALAVEPTPTPKPLPIKGVTVDVREMEEGGAAPGAATHIERPPMMRQFRAPAAESRQKAAPAAAPQPTPTPTPTPGRR